MSRARCHCAARQSSAVTSREYERRSTDRRLRATRQVVWSALQWLVPSVALALVPKCPLCVAAYVSLFTGIGLSLTTAAYLRYGFIAACLLSLAFIVVRLVYRHFASDRAASSP